MAKKPEEKKKAAPTPPAEAKEGVPAIYAAMAAVLRDVPAVGKDSTNKQQGWKFRGIDSIYNAIHDILAKHKVVMIPTVLGDPIREERRSNQDKPLFHVMLKVKYTFYAEDGSFIEAVLVGEAMDSGDKVANKALAAAQKYALIQSFCIETEDENGDNDPDATTHTVKSKEQSAKKAEPATVAAGSGSQARTPQQHLNSVKMHHKLFADAHDAERARTEILNASEFERTKDGVKTGEMVQGYDTIEAIEAKIKQYTIESCAGRLRVICHKMETAWKKELKKESGKEGL